MAQTPTPHNTYAPIPLYRFASAYEPGIWHGPSIAPPLQDVQSSAAQSATVGVVCFPNVSKSSLIDTLKWAKVRHFVSLGCIPFLTRASSW